MFICMCGVQQCNKDYVSLQVLGAGAGARQAGPAGVGGPAAREAREHHLHLRLAAGGAHSRRVQVSCCF